LDVFVARLPVFDRISNVFGYELAIQRRFSDIYTPESSCSDTPKVLSEGFLGIGFDKLTSGKKAFVNFNRNLLMQDIATAFPSDTLVIAVTEKIRPDSKIVGTCRTLRNAGYLLTFDDYVLESGYHDLLDSAAIVRVDLAKLSENKWKAPLKQVKTAEKSLLAANVESRQMFETVKDLGYTYFQGSFFREPDIVAGKDFSPRKLANLQLLLEVNRSDLTRSQLREIFKRDAALSYKLLRYINSVFWGFPKKITSIKHALALIGMNEAKKLLLLVVMGDIGIEKPKELMVTAVLRAIFCESLARCLTLEDRASELYLTGLFSLLDVFLDQDMNNIISKLPLADDISNCLVHREGPFAPVLGLITLHEKADWPELIRLVDDLGVRQVDLLDHFIRALGKANQIFAI
jgi:EAL and modified HD-GYP domain-containing signal transduction protein